jgi:DNA-binding response OmpR family regulator
MSANQDQDIQAHALLVDDEPGFIEIMTKRLKRRGFRVTSVLSGTEALRSLRRQDYDIVVLDLKMEDMDGIEVLRILKTIAPEIPVIILTGHGSEEAAVDGLALGAFDYLMKPCDLEELINVMQKAVQEKGK